MHISHLSCKIRYKHPSHQTDRTFCTQSSYILNSTDISFTHIMVSLIQAVSRHSYAEPFQSYLERLSKSRLHQSLQSCKPLVTRCCHDWIKLQSYLQWNSQVGEIHHQLMPMEDSFLSSTTLVSANLTCLLQDSSIRFCMERRPSSVSTISLRVAANGCSVRTLLWDALLLLDGTLSLKWARLFLPTCDELWVK